MILSKEFKFAVCIFIGLSLTGCSHVKEFTKKLWGSSTRALEDARIDAIRKSFACRYEDCFDEVLKIVKEENLYVFIKDKMREHIVLLEVPGSVDTTEVGIFFTDYDDQTRVDISSLSEQARITVAGIVFPKLSKVYAEVQ